MRGEWWRWTMPAAVTLLALGACSDAEPGPRGVARVELSQAALTVAVGDSVELKAVARTEDGRAVEDVEMSWVVSDDDVATIRVSGAAAIVTGRAGGVATVRATAGGKDATSQITVVHSVPVLEAVTPNSAPAGRSGLVVTVTGTGFVAGSEVHFGEEALPTGVISATELRAMLALEHLWEEGTAAVTVVNPQPGGGRSAPVTFTVTPAVMAYIELDRREATIAAGAVTVLTATPRDIYGRALTNRQIAWQSGDSAVATVADGLVHGLKVGAATITASSEGYSATAQITVTAPQVGGVRLTPPSDRLLWQGDVVQINAVALDAQGRPLPGVAITWQSSRPDVARVEGGRVEAVGSGQTIITASASGFSATTSLDVYTPPAEQLIIEHDSPAGLPELWIVDVGPPYSGRRLLAAGTYGADPAVAPGGQRIAFVGRAQAGTTDLFVVNRDGSGLQRLTTSGAADQPAWSRDGARIAFRDRSDGAGGIRVINADGTGERRVSQEGDFGISRAERPTWSPDGRVVYAYGLDVAPFSARLFSALPDGSDHRVVVSGTYSDTEPEYSRDGSALLVRRTHSHLQDWLTLLDAGTGSPYIWIFEPGQGRMPALGEDGLWVAFVSGADATSDVVIGRFGAQLRKTIATGRNPAWLPR